MARAAWILAAAAVVAIVVIGLTQASEDRVEEPAREFDLAAAKRDLAGAPAPLAALHEQSATLIEGGFADRLEELRGHPIVINKWGSWCGPCRSEFPIFQQVAAELGKEVAFLGINGQDPRDSAEEFLAEYPVTFPSYVDDDGDLADSVRSNGPFPMTAFVTADGEVETAIAVQYETTAQLKADIRRYLKR